MNMEQTGNPPSTFFIDAAPPPPPDHPIWGYPAGGQDGGGVGSTQVTNALVARFDKGLSLKPSYMNHEVQKSAVWTKARDGSLLVASENIQPPMRPFQGDQAVQHA